jgi:signal transduction histidine kinase
MAAGDFRAELPPITAGSDFQAVRSAFHAMGAALARSTAALRDADLDRRRLFADLAHELATPTTTLLGIAHALRDEAGDRARLLEHLGHETARLERLIADVREVAHLEDPALAMAAVPCDLGELARRATERAQLAAPATCRLRCEAAELVVTADPLRIEQVLTNLLGNAVRHAPAGTVRVAVVADGGDAVLRVEDSGPGVPEDQLPLLGRRLLRVDPSRSRDTGGHGLGLSIVRGIVARHHGGVTFSRAELGGLAVEVRLPREQPAT